MVNQTQVQIDEQNRIKANQPQDSDLYRNRDTNSQDYDQNRIRDNKSQDFNANTQRGDPSRIPAQIRSHIAELKIAITKKDFHGLNVIVREMEKIVDVNA